MNKLVYVTGATLLLIAGGCENSRNTTDNGPISGPGSVDPPPSATTLNCSIVSFARSSELAVWPAGIWLGSLTDCATNLQNDYVLAMVSADGKFRIIDANEHLLAGTLHVEGDLFFGSGTDFAPTGVEYFSGSTTGLFVEGKTIERDRLHGRWGTEWGNFGYFTFDYVQQTYERATSLADLAGVWSSSITYSGLPYPGTWTVEMDGRFNGQDNTGCLQSGQFSLIDVRYSILEVEVSVTGCALAGTYNGLAMYEDLVDWWERSITISIDDGTRALRYGLSIERQ